MRLIIISATFILMSASAFAQNNSAKIIEAYGQTRYEQMASTNPGAIELLGKYAEHGFDIVDTNPKYNDASELMQVALHSKTEETVSANEFMEDYNSGNFNILNYVFFPSNETQIYRIAGTNKVLIIYNQQSILSK